MLSWVTYGGLGAGEGWGEWTEERERAGQGSEEEREEGGEA